MKSMEKIAGYTIVFTVAAMTLTSVLPHLILPVTVLVVLALVGRMVWWVTR